MSYRVFHRTWWVENKNGLWPNDLEPGPGPKKTIVRGVATEEAARAIAKLWNREHFARAL